MTMEVGELFPPAQRVFYLKAPLIQVTCQLTFPPLLTIEKELPAAFQERVRYLFPLLERPVNLSLPPQLPVQIVELIRAQAGLAGWRFSAEDKHTTIALAPDSLTLTTTKYETWEKFLDWWRPAVAALLAVYSPNFFSRSSLRYQDLIIRENLAINPKTPWSELIRKELLGAAATPEMEPHVEDASGLLRLRLPDGAQMALQHGVGKQVGSNQIGYVIDLDFATTSKTEVNDAESALTALHQNVWRAFRWCITDALHHAFEPTNQPASGV
jgi:uncharacterized protein (TIGR04255 family)